MALGMSWRDLLSWATAITAVRALIAVIITWVPVPYRLPLYLFALLTDVADGTVARAMGTESRAGAILDGWVDKTLHVNLAWAMAVEDRFPDWFLLCWFSREILQAPMVPILTRRFRLAKGPSPSTNLAGRITALLLAISMTIVLSDHDATVCTLLTGACGVWSACWYGRDYFLPWWRAWRAGEET
jgi:phosphatidylglycerophosphate synthase